ncbi:hypothetical protein BJ742DRAFT_767189 [Cladochytrium replicatum]|nr:hypothetical protein BJ742DRAFT_767189 [Cladochytrium replicatum]
MISIDDQIEGETAQQLFAHYQQLEPVLEFRRLHSFSTQSAKNFQVHPRQVVELFGDTGTGKTELILQSMAWTILPKFWTFNIDEEELVKIMRVIVDRAFTQTHVALSVGNESVNGQIDSLIDDSLGLIYVARPQSTFELLSTLTSLEGFLQESERVHFSLLVVDSLSSFFWADRAVESKVPGKFAYWDEEDMFMPPLQLPYHALLDDTKNIPTGSKSSPVVLLRQTRIQLTIILKNLSVEWSLALLLSRWDMFRSDKGTSLSAKFPFSSHLIEMQRDRDNKFSASMTDLSTETIHFFAFGPLV